MAQRYFSPSTSGFYVEGVNPTIPADRVAVADALYTDLMNAQQRGKIIRWDAATRQPVAVDRVAQTLATRKDAVWARVKGLRESKKAAGLRIASIGRFDTDKDSRFNIASAAATAQSILLMLPIPAWSIDWTLSDNSRVTLTAAKMVTVQRAVVDYVSAVYARAAALRAAINAAPNDAALAAIDITAGWPSNG